ncbi:MAG: ADP-ribosylglycohydrolase family protein [Thermomicrobia bacterium]|nr:ADP-ribosylglycohydrolase family protein [Thermomicrobia bacterium]MCA1723146.1 ADP-ribosylglycohydrolase family protein [Thermomicrobia bacterium]
MSKQTVSPEQFAGCMLGLACGDALGATLEFLSRDEIRARYGQLREIIGGGWLRLAPGEVTDDTQMATCIAESIIATGTVDGDDIARRFVAWLHSDPKDIGTTTRRALMYLDRGVSWQEAGERTYREAGGQGIGNGGVMRCAPVGLFRVHDLDRLIADTRLSSAITHADPLAQWAAVAINVALRELLLNGQQPDFLARVAAVIEERAVAQAVRAVPFLGADEVRSTGYALHTMQTALWSLTHHPTFEEAVIAAVNFGDDADTSGAVTGALAGAREGSAAIPERWLNALRPRDALRALAHGLHEKAVA